MTEEEIKEIFTPVAVCPICHKQLTIRELHSTYKQNWLLRHELFRKLVYECKYCRCELAEQDFIKKSVNIKGVGNVDINNLTETEQQDFYRLLKKMNGEEPDKEENVKVRKPQELEEYFYIDDTGDVVQSRWTNDYLDVGRWELGIIFFTKEEAEFAREKRKVEVELQRYAEEHNERMLPWGDIYEHYSISLNCRDNKLTITASSFLKKNDTYFTSEKVGRDAIEAVGKDRILKYIFGVESENVE